jgi:hypothetical protein
LESSLAPIPDDGVYPDTSLQDEEPEAFYLPRTRPVEFRNCDRHDVCRSKMPMMRLDEEKNLRGIRLANFLCGPVALPADQIEPVYRAYCEFYSMFSVDCCLRALLAAVWRYRNLRQRPYYACA